MLTSCTCSHRDDVRRNVPPYVAKAPCGETLRGRNQVHHVMRYAWPATNQAANSQGNAGDGYVA
eukprot:1194255-Prorocentrum_minimum.AAC.3